MPDFISQETLEARLISSIRDLSSLNKCVEAGVTADTFITGPNNKVWGYLLDHTRRQGGNLPTDDDLLAVHGFVTGDPGDLDTYLNEALARHVGRKARIVLSKYLTTLDADPGGTVRALSRELSDLKLGVHRRVVRADKDALSRLTSFDLAVAAAERNEILGIPTGLKWFNDNRYGYLPGEMVGIIGTTEIGKSWFMLYMAAVAYNSGKKVLVFSPEMTGDELSIRWDVLLAQLKGVTFSHDDITQGRADRKRYESWLMSLQGRDDFTIIDSAEVGRPLNFDDIWRYTMDYQPDMVCIDGLDLIALAGGKGKKDYEVLKEGGAMLKSLAQQARVPILFVHQGNRGTADNPFTPPGKADVAYGYSVSTICDTMFGIARDKRSPDIRVYMVQKLRGHAKPTNRKYMHWDVDHGNIYEEDALDPGDFEDGGF